MERRNIVQFEKEPLQDHCGILAAYSFGGDIPYFHHVVNGLQLLQTRGQDGAGLLAFSADGEVHIHKGEGMVDEVFTPDVLRKEVDRKAKLWGAQTRYGTDGGYIAENVQPFKVNHRSGDAFFVAHNGQFSAKPGSSPTKFSDSYLFTKELEQSVGETWDERVVETIKKKNGAYSLIIGTVSSLYLIRDIMGIRPLSYGKINSQNGSVIVVAASETEALSRMGATRFYEVMPGTMVKFSDNDPQNETIIPLFPKQKKFINGAHLATCVFENVYISDRQSRIHAPRKYPAEINAAPMIYTMRQKSGEILAREASLTINEVDLAIGVPGTGIDGGEAYARVCGIPYHQAITDKEKQKDQRTFISANIDTILEKVMNHFNFDENILAGKRVVLIDDSIVRGNVTLGLIRLLKERYGVKEVHLRILCPPIDKTCHLGVNTRNSNELIAARNNGIVYRIGKELGADSLAYLSGEGLLEAIVGNTFIKGFCMGCMAGFKYPVDKYGNSY